MSDSGGWEQRPQGRPEGPGTDVVAAGWWAHHAHGQHAHGQRSLWHRRGRGTAPVVTNIILLCLVALVTVATLVVSALALGANVFLVCGALALVPLTICVLTLAWIDRWEPEPKAALLLAFCWGAGMAVVIALVLGGWVQPLLMSGQAASRDLVDAVVQAPLVEELCKGAGVLLLFFVRRRTFDGPVDGVVYAGMVGAGFAFTENILYFGQALDAGHGGLDGLFGIFIVRGLMSPFAHVMFTGALGACVGYAARHGGTAMVAGAWAVGLVPAMALHGLWNSSTFIGAGFVPMYFVLQVPIFVLFIVGVVLLRRAEARLTRRRLLDYVPSGWFSQAEVPMLATGAGRRRALAWAHSFGAGKVMKEFISTATRLAFTRQRLMVDAGARAGTAGARRFAAAQEQELALLHRATAVRSKLLAKAQQARPDGVRAGGGG